MLECRACVLRSIRAIAADSAPLLNGPLVLTPRLPVSTPRRRRLTTSAAPVPKDALGTSYPPTGRTNPKEETTRLTSTSTQRALQAELKYLTDPLKLASHIHYVLRQNDPAKALDLARLASKATKSTSDVVVAWNHCVDWHMRSGRVTEAIKIYNEMKKRGVFPDAHTYTLLFRSFMPKKGDGVAEGTVAKATSIYYSMLTPTSRVKPGIIHTNAVLKVCSMAGDMDALWGVAARIPEQGPGSADTVTYTILLSAIRYGAMGTADEGGVYLEQVGGQRQSAVNEGRRIWMECIAKWRNGGLVIDAELVCQMGHLLLISNRMEDWDDVLSLVEQTTKIPRQIVPFDHPDRRIGHVPQKTSIGEDVTQTSPTEEEDQDGFLPTPASKAFNSVPTKNTKSPIWVHPGNPILSVLIQACLTMRIPKAANAYWEIITSPPHSLTPDLANYQSMLRLFRINRSSLKAATLIEKMHSQEGGNIPPRGLTYRDALAVCQRDHKNPSIIAIAMRIVNDMGNRMEYPDVQTLQAFLSLAMTRDSGNEITAVLDTLDEFVPLVSSRIGGSIQEDNRIARKEDSRRGRLDSRKQRGSSEERDAVAFVKQMASAIQIVMSKGMVPKHYLPRYIDRRNLLNSYISRAENRNVKNWYFEHDDGTTRYKTLSERKAEFERIGAMGSLERAKRGKANAPNAVGGKPLVRYENKFLGRKLYGGKSGNLEKRQDQEKKRDGVADSAGEMAEV